MSLQQADSVTLSDENGANLSVTYKAHRADVIPFPIPTESDFKDEHGESQDFLPGEELRKIAETLISRPSLHLAHLDRIPISYLWKQKGGASHGKSTLGKCQVATGLIKHFSEVSFVIWLAADHLGDANVSKTFVEACLYHELLHIEENEDGKLVLRNHDFEGFVEELKIYGCWREDLTTAKEVFQQVGLFESAEDCGQCRHSWGSHSGSMTGCEQGECRCPAYRLAR